MTVPESLTSEPFVALTTFRRSGEAVATPLWLVRDGDAAAFWTPRSTGKVKRLRNDTRVEMRPCNRRGQVAPGASVVVGTAEIVDDAAVEKRLRGSLAAKYGIQFRVVTLIEKLRPSMRDRVVIRVTTNG